MYIILTQNIIKEKQDCEYYILCYNFSCIFIEEIKIMERCNTDVHDLRWVAVWIDSHCFMLKRCLDCRRFSVGYICVSAPLPNSTEINIDQIPVDKLKELRAFIERTKPEEINRRIAGLRLRM